MARVASRLGQVPDAVLAREISAGWWDVRRLRERKRVAKCYRRRSVDVHLGTAPDRVIARRSGLSWRSVIRRRHELGVPAFGRKRAAAQRGIVAYIEDLLS